MREGQEEDEEEEEEIGRVGERACGTLLLSQYLIIKVHVPEVKNSVNSVWFGFLRWILEHVTRCLPQKSIRITHGGGQVHLA